MSSPFQPGEPPNPFIETASLGRLFCPEDVTLTYNTTSRSMFDFCLIRSVSFCPPFQMYLGFMWILLGYAVQNGRIVDRTGEPGVSTTLKIVSNGGHRYTVTRKRGGGMNKQSTMLTMRLFRLETFLRNKEWLTLVQCLKSLLLIFHHSLLYQQLVYLGTSWLDSKKLIIR